MRWRRKCAAGLVAAAAAAAATAAPMGASRRAVCSSYEAMCDYVQEFSAVLYINWLSQCAEVRVGNSLGSHGRNRHRFCHGVSSTKLSGRWERNHLGSGGSANPLRALG